jgi:hypothetical protein
MTGYARVGDGLASGKRGQLFKAEVDADLATSFTLRLTLDAHRNAHGPAFDIADEFRGENFAFWQMPVHVDAQPARHTLKAETPAVKA